MLRPGKLFSPHSFQKDWFQCPTECRPWPMVQNPWLANVLLLKRISLKTGMYVNNSGNEMDTQAEDTSRVQRFSRYSWSRVVLSSSQLLPDPLSGRWWVAIAENWGREGTASQMWKFISADWLPHRCCELPSQSTYSWPSEHGWPAQLAHYFVRWQSTSSDIPCPL